MTTRTNPCRASYFPNTMQFVLQPTLNGGFIIFLEGECWSFGTLAEAFAFIERSLTHEDPPHLPDASGVE